MLPQTLQIVTHKMGVTISTPPPGQYDHDPRWSPDGSKIAFIRVVVDTLEETSISNLWVMNADGTGEVQLTAKSSVN